ncbi:MAG: ketoacyl-ACP synthase III [Planctomycetaceae bacterium]|nr:ketoacyl-ACP synthase III [Planctomycetaceae bacterium]
MIRVKIAGVGCYLPERRVHNDELSQDLDTSNEWIVSHTGISYRHLASETDSASSMGLAAARAALEMAGVEPHELGKIILSTTTADFAPIPATACLIQRELDATGAAAFDLAAACCGFVFGLEIMRGMMQFDKRPTLLIGSELMSRIINWSDKKTCVLFGDGAGAAVLNTVDDSAGLGLEAEPSGIIDTYMQADGSGADFLRIEGGSRTPESRYETNASTLFMDGRAVFAFAIRTMPEVILALLERNNLKISDVDWIVPHQANYRIIKSAALRLGIPLERFYLNVDEVANTASASIPIALTEMHQKGMLQSGTKIITVGFGAGLTYGGNLIVW